MERNTGDPDSCPGVWTRRQRVVKEERKTSDWVKFKEVKTNDWTKTMKGRQTSDWRKTKAKKGRKEEW